MTITTILDIRLAPHSPFATLEEQQRLREEAERTALEMQKARRQAERELAEQQRIDREAEAARVLAENRRLANEQQAENDRIAAAEKARLEWNSPEQRNLRKQKYIDLAVRQFVNILVDSTLYKVAKERNWSSTAMKLALGYASALISTDDVELPKLGKEMEEDINGAFAAAMVKYLAKADRNNIPDSYFVGQRQPWYTDLLASAKKSR